MSSWLEATVGVEQAVPVCACASVVGLPVQPASPSPVPPNPPAGFDLCGDSPANWACVDRGSDGNNCGECGNTCSGGKTCQGGTCACPAGACTCLAALTGFAGVAACVTAAAAAPCALFTACLLARVLQAPRTAVAHAWTQPPMLPTAAAAETRARATRPTATTAPTRCASARRVSNTLVQLAGSDSWC